MRTVVLGSGSFAARDFIDVLLASGNYDVLAIGRRRGAERPPDRLDYRQMDINSDFDAVCYAVDEFAPDYIINFLAQGDDASSWKFPADFFQTNCTALARLLDHLKHRRYLRRFLQISSSGVYGNPSHSLSENARLLPGSPYAVSKAAADLLVLAYHANLQFPAQVLRPPNLYGPHQQLFRVIPKTIITIKRGGVIELHGGGEAIRSYLHIRDASLAALTILERGQVGAVYNASPDESWRIREIVAYICDLLGVKFERVTRDVDDRPGQLSAQNLESGKIRELGWMPQIPLREGIAGVRAWIERDWSGLCDAPLEYRHRP